MKVNLYIQGKTKNPAKQKKAQARWLISCALSNGVIEKRDGAVTLNDATTKRAVLYALSQALQKFNKAAVIKIYISDDYVRAVFLNSWISRWKNNAWHKIRLNGDIKHLDLWKEIAEQLSKHAVTFAKGKDLDNEILDLLLALMERRIQIWLSHVSDRTNKSFAVVWSISPGSLTVC